MTRHVAPSEQGRLQGANGGSRRMSGMIGPLLFTMTFKCFIGVLKGWQLPGAPFLLAAALLLAGRAGSGLAGY